MSEAMIENYKCFLLNGLDTAHANAHFMGRDDIADMIAKFRDKVCGMLREKKKETDK